MADASDDYLDLLDEPDEPSALEKQQAYSAALRRRRDAGQLGLLTGDPVLSRLGQNELAGADRGEQQLMALGQRRAALKNARDISAANQAASMERLKYRLGLGRPVDRAKQDLEAAQAEAARARAEAELARARRLGAPIIPKPPKRDSRGERLDLLKQQLQVAGFAPLDPLGKMPLADEATALANQNAGAIKIRNVASQLKDLYEKNPHAFPVDTAMSRMQALASELTPTAAAAGGYGQLTSGHQHLLDAAIGDPAALKNYINSERFPALLDELMNGADTALDAKAQSLGQRRLKPGELAPRVVASPGALGAAMPAPPVQAPGAQDSEIVMVLPPGGSAPVPVHRTKLAAALAAGGSLVK